MPLSKSHWFYIPVNPVQWEVGPLSTGRRDGKVFPRIGRSENLHSFQEEVKEELGDAPIVKFTRDVEVHFYFWQKLETYRAPSGRLVTKKAADATNMQKATEDALQDILFDNDRQVKRIVSEIVEQGKDVDPGIAIMICDYNSTAEIELPGWLLSRRLNPRRVPLPEDNSWPPREGL